MLPPSTPLVEPVQKYLRALVIIVLGFVMIAPDIGANDDLRQTLPDSFDAEAREKIVRYHEALITRPLSEALLDRMIDEWSKHASLESLQPWLEQRASEENASGADALLHGIFVERHGDAETASKAFETAWERDSNLQFEVEHRGRAAPPLARNLLRLKNAEKALYVLDAADSKARSLNDNQEIEALRLRARCLQHLNRGSEIPTVWNRVLEAAPDDGDLWEDAITELWREGHVDEAEDYLRILIDRHKASDPPATARRRLWLAEWLGDLDRQPEADVEFEKVLDQSGSGSWLERSVIAAIESRLRITGNVTDLADQLQEWTKSRPDRLALRFRLGEVLVELGRSEEGFGEIRETLQRSPGRKDLQERFAYLLESSVDTEAAVRQWRQLVERSPDNIDLLLELARAEHAHSAQSTAAAESVQRWLDRQPSPTATLLIRAAVLFERYGDAARTEASLDLAMEVAGRDLGPRLRMAAFLYRIPDRRSEALPLLLNAPSPTDVNDALRIGRTIDTLNKSSAALAYLKQHEEEFGRLPAFLETAGLMAEKIGDAPLAFDYSLRRLLALANDPSNDSDLRPAIVNAANLARKDGEILWSTASSDPQSLSIAERCLASELAAREKDFAAASQWLGNRQNISDNVTLTLQAVRNSGQAGDWSNAAELLTPLAKDEQSGQLRIRHVRELVTALERADNDLEALSWVALWKQQSPQNVEVWKKEISIRLRHSHEGLDLLRSAVHRFSDDLDLLSQYADMNANNHHKFDAETAYWKLYELDKGNPLKWIRKLHDLATQYGGYRARDEQASSRIRQRLEQRQVNNPTSVEPLLALAEIARLDSDIDVQIGFLNAMLRIDPDHFAVRLLSSKLRAASGDWRAAIDSFEQAGDLSLEELDRAHNACVEILLDHLQFTAAADRIEAEIGKRNVDRQTMSAWIDLLGVHGAFAEAARVERLLIDYNGMQPTSLYRLAVWLEEAGDANAALNTFRQAMRLASDGGHAPTSHAGVDDQRPNSLVETAVHDHFSSSYWYRPIGNHGPIYLIPTFQQLPTGLQNDIAPEIIWQKALCHIIGIHNRHTSPESEAALKGLGISSQEIEQILSAVRELKPADLNMQVRFSQSYIFGFSRNIKQIGFRSPPGSFDGSTNHQASIVPVDQSNFNDAIERGRYSQAARIVAPAMLNAITSQLASPGSPHHKADQDPFAFLALADSVTADCRRALREFCADLMNEWPEPRRRKYNAMLTLTLEGPDVAAPMIEKLLTENPRDDSLRLHFIATLLRTADSEGIDNAMLAATTALDFQPNSSAIQEVREWLFATGSWTEVKSAAEMIIHLRQLDGDKGDEIFRLLNPPVLEVWRSLIGHHRQLDGSPDSRELAPLFDLDFDFTLRVRKAPGNEKWIQERSDLHRRLSTVLLEIPKFHEVALVALCHQNRIEKLPPPTDAWEQALAIHSDPNYKAERGTSMRLNRSGDFVPVPSYDEKIISPSVSIHDLPSNADFLLWLAHSSGHQSDLSKQLIPVLRNNGREAIAESLDTMRVWYFAEGDDFASALVRIVDDFLATGETFEKLPTKLDNLRKAFKIGLERNQIDDVAEALRLLVTSWCRPTEEQDGFRLAEPMLMDDFCHRFLSSALGMLDDQQVSALMMPLLNDLAGPVNDRHSLLARAASAADSSPELRTIERLLHLSFMVVHSKNIPPSLYFQTWEINNQIGQWPDDMGNFRPLPTFDLLTDGSFLELEETVEFLIQRPAFLGSVEEFDCMPSSFGPDKPVSSALELVIERMRIDPSVHGHYASWLKESAGDKFGARLAGILLTEPGESPDPRRLESLLDEFEQLPINQQNALAALINRRLESPRQSRDLLSWLSKQRESAWKSRFEQWQGARTLRNFDQAPGDEIAALLLDAAKYNRFEDALEAWKWLNFWALREGRGTTADPDTFLRKALDDLDRQIDPENGTTYECNLVLMALLVHDRGVSPILTGKNPFPIPSSPWSAIVSEAERQSKDEFLKSAESAFQKSVEGIGELAADRDIDDLTALMIAGDADWVSFADSVRFGATTKGPAQSLWQKLDLMLPPIEQPAELDYRGLIKFFDPDASLQERAFVLQRIGQMVRMQTDYPRLRNSPAKYPDSSIPEFPRAFLNAENPTAVVKTMLEVLREPRTSDWQSLAQENFWIRLILFEIFSPLPAATDPASQSEIDLQKKFRDAMMNFSEHYVRSETGTGVYRGHRQRRALTAEWQVTFATFLLSENYSDAEKMWQKLEAAQAAETEDLNWPDNDIHEFVSPLHSSVGELLELPEKLENFASFWTARKVPAQTPDQESTPSSNSPEAAKQKP